MSHSITPVTELSVGVHSGSPASSRSSESASNADARLAALLAAHACPKTHSTAEVARIFGKTDQWVYWVLREGVTRADGSLIEPERVGKGNRRRFTRSVVEEIAVALYRRGTLGHDGVCQVIANLDAAEGLAA
ncbi:helix-turn-helix domain-containing protein [Rhodococcus sp. Q]|uniref:helix-turn-helix domain-containing protein n=1 Tax=Rhodococcus sp. Q TaxID=2502252 RepID=UPI0010F4FB66|nr:helix-turn-helix domain-containing protein [Rhodococcus sp. Q]